MLLDVITCIQKTPLPFHPQNQVQNPVCLSLNKKKTKVLNFIYFSSCMFSFFPVIVHLEAYIKKIGDCACALLMEVYFCVKFNCNYKNPVRSVHYTWVLSSTCSFNEEDCEHDENQKCNSTHQPDEPSLCDYIHLFPAIFCSKAQRDTALVF